MIYDVLPFMPCTFFKGLFLNSCTFFKGLFTLFCHFSKGLSVAKIRNFLLKGKENGNYFLLKRKFICFLSNPCGFSYMHKRREYLNGKANGGDLPSREEGIFKGWRSN